MENVLIVDDEKEILDLMASAVSRWGYNPIVAENGDAAVKKLEAHPIDVVITDLRMPKKNGIELLQHIREKDDSTSVIIFTGYPALQSAIDSMKSGAFDYLLKPVDLAQLKIKLDKAIKEKQARQGAKVLKNMNWALLISIPFWLILGIILLKTLR
ncbi:MAG TPA: response regulator [Bacteroidetes bacterium]|nr:response regulator [Bacteroidota bacterium]